MSKLNAQKRRQVLYKRFERSLARRDLVDGLQETAVTLELARLRGIEEEAFRLVEQLIGAPLEAQTPAVRAAITHLEHALMVETAAVPTLRAAPDAIELLENPATYRALVESLPAKFSGCRPDPLAGRPVRG
jgi:hypothetical protein